VTRNFIRSKSGMALQAMRDSETGALAVGINASHYKLLAFVLASAFAGLAGVLYAHSVSYLNTGNFGLDLSINLLAITIIGGMGTVWGVVLGSLPVGLCAEPHGSGLEMLTGVLFGVILAARRPVPAKGTVRDRLQDLRQAQEQPPAWVTFQA